MFDLGPVAGIAVFLKQDGTLSFGPGVRAPKPQYRSLDELRPVLKDESATGPGTLYTMYRGVCKDDDENTFSASGVRYDLTVVSCGSIGKEYIKTLGHYHPKAPASQYSYPEVYEVLYGIAHYIIQTTGDDIRFAKDVAVVRALPGQKVFIPPDYGHVTVNPGGTPLVMSNLVERGFSSDYSAYIALKGAAVYEISENGVPGFVNNQRYSNAFSLRTLDASTGAGAAIDGPLYSAFVRDPERFAFLSTPELMPSG